MSTDTVRVAVRAITGDDTDRWRIVEAPVDCIGNYDAEAHHIYPLLPEGAFRGDVIVVDAVSYDGEEYAAGCSTWTRFDANELDQARAEHWNCEHTLFGATPTEGWTQETDPAELAEYEALEWWTFRTGEYADGEYEAIVARYSWAEDPNTWYLTVFRDEHGPIVEQVATEGFDDAKESGIATIQECIEGL